MYFVSRKALVAAILGCALLAGFASPGAANPQSDLEKQKKGVSGKIGDAKKDLESSSKKYVVATAALKKAQMSLDMAQSLLSATRGQLAVAQARDVQMQAALNYSETALDKAKAELADGENSLEASELQVKQFTLETLQEGDRGLRAFSELLRGQSPTAFSEQMSLNESVSDAQIATMQRLAASKVMLRINRDKVRKLRDGIAVKRKEAASNLVTKKQLETSAEAQTTQVTQLVGARARAKQSANAARQADAALLASLEADRNRLSAQLKALADKARREGGNSAGGDGGGTLSRPVNGPVTSSYGMRKHPITGVYKLHDGTDFGAGCGTPVRAAASGTIIQQYYNAGYGNRVIVDNGIMRGKSVVTTYNHLSGFAAGVGQKVTRGQVIAYAGTTGMSTGCHLHLMVITDGYTVNPMSWL